MDALGVLFVVAAVALAISLYIALRVLVAILEEEPPRKPRYRIRMKPPSMSARWIKSGSQDSDH